MQSASKQKTNSRDGSPPCGEIGPTYVVIRFLSKAMCPLGFIFFVPLPPKPSFSFWPLRVQFREVAEKGPVKEQLPRLCYQAATRLPCTSVSLSAKLMMIHRMVGRSKGESNDTHVCDIYHALSTRNALCTLIHLPT